MNTYKAILKSLLLLALLLPACGSPERSTCGERNIALWTRATVLESAPIVECGSVVGYKLDIDATSGARSWVLTNSEPHPANGPVEISADIDTMPGVDRMAVLIRGPATYDLQHGNADRTAVSASTNTTAGPLLREFRIAIPSGIRYVGEIRNLRW